jgi:hypothetical protein
MQIRRILRHNVSFIADPPMSVDRDIALVSGVLFAANTSPDRSSEPFETSRASTNEVKKARIPVRNPISLTVNGGIAKEEDHDYPTRQLTERANLNSLLSLSRTSGEMPESLSDKSPNQSQLCLDRPFHRWSMGLNISGPTPKPCSRSTYTFSRVSAGEISLPLLSRCLNSLHITWP